MQYPKKLTTGTCGLDVSTCERLVANHEKSVAVLNIGGTISGFEEKTTTLGKSIMFTGEFQGDNHISGESYRAMTMYLPGVAEAAVAPMLATMKKGEKISFALQIMVSYYKPQNDKGTKFTWAVKNLLEPKEDDSLAKLMKGLAGPKAVEAPKAAPKK